MSFPQLPRLQLLWEDHVAYCQLTLTPISISTWSGNLFLYDWRGRHTCSAPYGPQPIIITSVLYPFSKKWGIPKPIIKRTNSLLPTACPVPVSHPYPPSCASSHLLLCGLPFWVSRRIPALAPSGDVFENICSIFQCRKIRQWQHVLTWHCKNSKALRNVY